MGRAIRQSPRDEQGHHLSGTLRIVGGLVLIVIPGLLPFRASGVRKTGHCKRAAREAIRSLEPMSQPTQAVVRGGEIADISRVDVICWVCSGKGLILSRSPVEAVSIVHRCVV